MKNTQKFMNELQQAMNIHQERVEAITRRASMIAKLAPSMSYNDLQRAIEEVKELRKELAEHKAFLRKAELQKKSFYAPATVA